MSSSASVSLVFNRPGRYADLAPLPQPTGSDVQRQMASLKARLIARYKLHAVPGRPEELEANRPVLNEPIVMGKPIVVGDPGKVVSLGYGCRTIRIRKHDGRKWSATKDIQVREGWHAEVYAYLDEYFGFVSPSILA